MAKRDRGFALMDQEKRRQVARLGGQAAQAEGTGHRWTTEEARAAGKKGGTVGVAKRNAARIAATDKSSA